MNKKTYINPRSYVHEATLFINPSKKNKTIHPIKTKKPSLILSFIIVIITFVNKSEYLNKKKETLIKQFENTPFAHNPLWYTSILRVYGLKALEDFFNLNSFVHFDSDVIIYKSFKELNNFYDFNEKKINITKNDKNDLVFGYSYFPNKTLIENLFFWKTIERIRKKKTKLSKDNFSKY